MSFVTTVGNAATQPATVVTAAQQRKADRAGEGDNSAPDLKATQVQQGQENPGKLNIVT
ncbi:MAG TPA: hypothetical protein VMB71_13705 [Acetobacteraceae bacterium]|nr:hypothetical protein [Acetobacteraceae bacterium]